MCIDRRMRRRDYLLVSAVTVAAAISVLSAAWRAGRPIATKVEVVAHTRAQPAESAHSTTAESSSRGVIPENARDLLNAEDLFDAFERARRSDRPDAWLVARQIAEGCVGVTSDAAVRNSIDRAIGEFNSTDVMAPDRDRRLRTLNNQKAALDALEQRCRKFREFGRAWAHSVAHELVEKTRGSDGEIGRLMRASEQVSRGAGDYGQWVSALASALASNNEVAEDLAIVEMSRSLFDRRMAPGDRPRYSALGALKEAWWQVRGQSGADLMRDFERLLLCISGGTCLSAGGLAFQPELEPNVARSMDTEYRDIVAQYVEGLRRNDPELIFRVQPRR